MKNKIAIFPGTFDPFTLGHHDIVLRGLKIFDTIHIAIGNNPEKERYFDVELIKNKIKELYKDENKINIILYNELTAEISKKLNANFILSWSEPVMMVSMVFMNSVISMVPLLSLSKMSKSLFEISSFDISSPFRNSERSMS